MANSGSRVNLEVDFFGGGAAYELAGGEGSGRLWTGAGEAS